jgi:hypothetical protein
VPKYRPGSGRRHSARQVVGPDNHHDEGGKTTEEKEAADPHRPVKDN